MVGEGYLREFDAVRPVRIKSGAEDDEGGAGTYDEGIGEDAQGLYESLLDGVRHAGGSCGVRRTALAGFVAEESALEAHKHRPADGTSYDGRQAEGIFDDDAQHAGDKLQIRQHYPHGNGEIAQCHDGDDDGTHLRYALYAAEDDEEGEGGQGGCHPVWAYAEGLREGRGDGVGLHHIVRQSELADDGYGEDAGKPAFADALGDIVGRPADEGVLRTLLEQLCQRTLHEGIDTADEGHDPHPEHCARPADDDGSGNACQVARTDARGEGDGESLERTDVLAFARCAFGAEQQAEHLADEPKLHSARLYGEPNAREREEEDHQSAQGVVDGVEEMGEEGFHCLFLESETL